MCSCTTLTRRYRATVLPSPKHDRHSTDPHPSTTATALTSPKHDRHSTDLTQARPPVPTSAVSVLASSFGRCRHWCWRHDRLLTLAPAKPFDESEIPGNNEHP